ncbi:MAG: hypothetical protein E7158_00840 [Firmicutes bacterium]|nr:hypothetical protein [Bacillota bacterium]
MKKLLKFFKDYSIGTIAGLIIGISIAVYANSITSNEVTYSHTLTSQTTVKGTLDELIDTAHTCGTTCPDGYECTEKRPICKRVGHSSELHTETCNQSYGHCAETRGNGHSITYGNVGTKGTLATGDAFDCDVMGDGSYMVNGEAARFYYVSTMAGHSDVNDSNYAVLVYYTNVVNGHNNTTGVAWATMADTGLSSNSNTKGPVTAKKHLPGNAPVSWPGVSLKSSTRLITDEIGTPVVDFDYGRAQARLLTYQEVYNGCYNGSINLGVNNGIYSKCEFLLENTKYTNSSNSTTGPWLETPVESRTDRAWSVYSNYRNVNGGSAVSNSLYCGVRPAIEVPLEDIDY